MNLTKEEIQGILYCIDLIIQYHGYNEKLENIYKKLFKEVNNENTAQEEKELLSDLMEE